MILCDTGPLVALVDKKQQAHGQCMALLRTLSKPLITTWPCLTEAMYLTYRVGGWPMQRLVWSYLEKGVVRLYLMNEADAERVQMLMGQYRDNPMDLADASLVVAAETLKIARIFTLDAHFHAYRIHGQTPFEVVP